MCSVCGHECDMACVHRHQMTAYSSEFSLFFTWDPSWVQPHVFRLVWQALALLSHIATPISFS